MKNLWIWAISIAAAGIVGSGLAAIVNIEGAFDLIDRSTAQTEVALELLEKYETTLQMTQAFLAQCEAGP